MNGKTLPLHAAMKRVAMLSMRNSVDYYLLWEERRVIPAGIHRPVRREAT